MPSVDWSVCSEQAHDITGATTLVPTFQCLPVLFQIILNAAILFTGLVSFFLFVIAGMRYLMSRGDPKAIEGAKSTIVYIIIGMTVIFFSFLLLNVIAYVTGVHCIVDFGFGVCL